jgi:hypothetical protein
MREGSREFRNSILVDDYPEILLFLSPSKQSEWVRGTSTIHNAFRTIT